MKGLQSVIKVVGLIVKYSVIVSAVIKAINVFHDEVQKIEVNND